ncbi:lipoprotein insertase outer membrane protein LolB [Candidatus Coxiella mudrowiae]|uniref:lipoprotein insertase outer membrane protein LolB n=1 Tax=Candidatus Coxiella mudrowiae TaxID=2054173 RepID=UPI000C281D94|nr:lipoprotein insertase outer membrane protein LolB [Candidatus Coxiella mudrowiae]
MKNYSRLILLSTLAATPGCTPTLRLPTQPTVTYTYQAQSWQKHYHALSQFSLWNIDGAFSIQEPGRTIIAEYEWQQKGTNYHIRIHSTLGIYSVEISGRPGMVMLWRSSQEHYTTRTPEQLLQQQLGWQLPVSNLYYWVRGIPAPGIYHGNFDSYGHLTVLQQKGWSIRFSRYSTIDSIVPYTLILNKGPFTIKIIIKSWQL